MAKAKLHIGTSGWHYKHWKGTFYPEDTKDKDQFELYTQYFDTVEINNSFYKLPDAKTFSNWKEAAPKGFLFSVKASRYLTHMIKLKADKASLRKFFTRAIKLGEKLGPILFQLPPRWKLNLQRLTDFLDALPSGHRYTFEFRDHSWYTKEVLELLKKHDCAFCIYHLEKHLSPLEVTASFVYVRLHGPGKKYQGSYNTPALKKWAGHCSQWLKEGRDVYIYFDNDQHGYAAFNAMRLQELTGK